MVASVLSDERSSHCSSLYRDVHALKLHNNLVLVALGCVTLHGSSATALDDRLLKLDFEHKHAINIQHTENLLDGQKHEPLCFWVL